MELHGLIITIKFYEEYLAKHQVGGIHKLIKSVLSQRINDHYISQDAMTLNELQSVLSQQSTDTRRLFDFESNIQNIADLRSQDLH